MSPFVVASGPPPKSRVQDLILAVSSGVAFCPRTAPGVCRPYWSASAARPSRCPNRSKTAGRQAELTGTLTPHQCLEFSHLEQPRDHTPLRVHPPPTPLERG